MPGISTATGLFDRMGTVFAILVLGVLIDLLHNVFRPKLAKFPKSRARVERQQRKPVSRLSRPTVRPLALGVDR